MRVFLLIVCARPTVAIVMHTMDALRGFECKRTLLNPLVVECLCFDDVEVQREDSPRAELRKCVLLCIDIVSFGMRNFRSFTNNPLAITPHRVNTPSTLSLLKVST